MKVRLLSQGHLKGKYNMGVDEAIQRACQRGEVPTTLRFYQWDPPCLSLGYFQDIQKEVSLDGLKEAGFDLVRRATGGKAVLHDDELTYSVIVSEKDLPGSVLETYHRISEALVLGLQNLGIPVTIAALEHGVTSRDPRFRQAACFSAPSWYEIVAFGKKVIGSAQNRKNGVILQHGSIPFVFDAKRLVKCLKTTSPEHAARAEAMLGKKAIGVSQALGRDVSREELENELVNGFRDALGWELEAGELTEAESAEALELAEEKYGSERWTLERGRLEGDIY